MKETLQKLKLIDYLKTDLPINRMQFIDRLSSITDPGETGMFSGPFESFSSSKNELKGKVNYDGFTLKRRKKFFDSNANMAVATGKIFEQHGRLTVETEINGFNNFFIVIYAFLIIIYAAAIFGIARTNSASFFTIPFLLLHGTFMFLIPYFMMRRSVKKLKYELEREFFYLTKHS
jgi:hypothetical protein